MESTPFKKLKITHKTTVSYWKKVNKIKKTCVALCRDV